MPILSKAVVTNRGLCSACEHGEVCIYPRSQDQIVLNCEQFELSPPMPSPPPNPEQVELEELWRKSSCHEPGKEFKGLCSNCEDRHTCIYPKPAEGVWRCEEYR